jgi:membrane protease YdiL (CAAX protease family)
MPNPFWNPGERRIRAFWRLILQVVLMFILETVAGIVLSTIAPQVVQALLDPTHLTQNPLLAISSTLVTFISILLSIWLAGRWFDHRPFKEFGLHLNSQWWGDLVFGLVLGAVLITFIFVVELVFGWVTIKGTFQSNSPGQSFGSTAIYGVFFFLAIGIQEELMSRGYMLRNLAEGLNLPWITPKAALFLGYLISSVAFGVQHVLNPNSTTISTINIMIAGLFLGLGFILTGELALPIGLHITWNYFEGYIFGFPVSGLTSAGNFLAIQQKGPNQWTGGAFGPEAGLIGLAAMLVGAGLILAWVHWRRGQISIQTKLAEYTSTREVPSSQEDQAVPVLNGTRRW